MARDGKGFGEKLFEAGSKLVSRAAERVLADPRGQDAVARAVGLAQRGRKRVEELQGRFLEAAGIPGRREYDDLAKQLARIKRKARELAEALERDGEAGGEEGEAEGAHAGPRRNGGSRRSH